MRDLIKQILKEYDSKDNLENIISLYEEFKNKLLSQYGFLDVSYSISKNKQKGKIIVNVKNDDKNFEDIANKVNEILNQFKINKEFSTNPSLAWDFFQWDFHPDTYKNFSNTEYIQDRKKYLDKFNIKLKDIIFKYNGNEDKFLEKKIQDFQRLNSDQVYNDILNFFQQKTDVPLEITSRNTSKTFFIVIKPQLTLQDFMSCKFTKWDFPLNISSLYEQVMNLLGYKNTEVRDWTFDIKLVWPREVGNYIVTQNEKLRDLLKDELKDDFAVRIDYFLCANNPTISIGSGHQPETYQVIPISKKTFGKLIRDNAKKIGIFNPKINYLDGYYWFTNSEYKSDDNRYWSKEKSFDYFVDLSKGKYGDSYEYDIDRFIDLDNLTEVYCKQHQRWFEVFPKEHISGKRCPFDNESKGETMVRVFLEKNKIKFNQYHKLKGCFSTLNNKCILLTFDFYLPELNMTIEYDGEQHYRPIERFGGEKTYERQVILDEIKNKFCKESNIKLIRIPYTVKKQKDINDILSKELNVTS